MLAELEMLIMCKKIRNDSIDSNDGTPAENTIAKEKQEKALDDENLCPICFNRVKDTKYNPCSHESCKVCIQTHMLNK